MPRPVWGGAISFGLVNVPVRLFTAVQKKTIRFHQLRKGDGCRINFKKICPLDGKEVGQEEIVKGYEVSPDRYIEITAEELEAVYPEKTRAIAIEDFVSLSRIDPLYFENTYYVVPEPGAAKPYTLLLAAMRRTGKIGIARVVIRNKEYLAALRPLTKALALSTLYFADEIVSQDQFEDAGEQYLPGRKELDMALALIRSMTKDFSPELYPDTYRERVREWMEYKAAGEALEARPAKQEEGAKVIDLMAALEASLKAAKAASPAKPKRKKTSAR